MRWLAVLALALTFGCGERDSDEQKGDEQKSYEWESYEQTTDCRMQAETLCKDKFNLWDYSGVFEKHPRYQKCVAENVLQCGATN